jgi:hypothetical protein
LFSTVASAPSHHVHSQNDGELFSRATLRVNSAISERCGASHLSVPLLIKVSLDQQPCEFFVISVAPLGEVGAPERATRDRARRCCPTFASGSPACPLEGLRKSNCVQDAPAEPFAIARLRHREWLRWLKDHIPPKMDLSLRGFQRSLRVRGRFLGAISSADSVRPSHQAST